MPLVASAAIVLVTLVNCAAVAVGGRIASVLAVAEGARSCSASASARSSWRDGDWAHFALSAAGGACEGVPAAARGGIAGFGAAMLGAMWAYNGWNEVTYVAGEVKDPSRNLPLAIIGGIGDHRDALRLRQPRVFLRARARRHRERLAGHRRSRPRSSRGFSAPAPAA